jgi:plasmid stabilization system protein ParE
MARFRLSQPAQTDLVRILSASLERWGTAGKRRYAATLATAMRKVANERTGLGHGIVGSFCQASAAFTSGAPVRAAETPRYADLCMCSISARFGQV